MVLVSVVIVEVWIFCFVCVLRGVVCLGIVCGFFVGFVLGFLKFCHVF